MSFQRIVVRAGLALGLSLMFSSIAFAQQPMPPQDGARRPMAEGKGGRHRGPGKGGRGAMRLFRELNLTDAQREQIRGIHERVMATTKSQHEALRNLRESNQGGQLSNENQARAQALRGEIEQAMKGAHQETLNVLTQEQRTQLEQLIQERKGRHKDRRGPGPGGPNASQNP